MTHYFKVKTGFGVEDFISIDETELERATYAQVSGAVVLLKNGTVRGTMIQTITPDWHRTMGWNPGYKLQPEDMVEIKGNFEDEQRLIALAGDRVRHHINSGTISLIGKEPLKLEAGEISDQIAALADTFKLD